MPPEDSNQPSQPQTPPTGPPTNPFQPQPPVPQAPQPAPESQQPPQPQPSFPPAPEAQPTQPQFEQPAPAPQPGMQFAPPPKPDSNVLGILGIVLSFFFWPAGLVCSIIALKKHTSKALAIVGLVFNILAMLATVGIILLLVLATSSGIQGKAKDTKYTTDIKTIQTQLENVYVTDGAYPSLEELNSETWRQSHMSSLSPAALSPNSSQTQLVSGTPTVSAYAYNPLPKGCGNNTTKPCKSYDLATKFTTGSGYSVHSLN